MSRNPICWSELPEKVWLKVFQILKVEDVNNVHLVCRNLHQIANLHVNPILRFGRNSPKQVEGLVQSSRIFEELCFVEKCNNYLLHQDIFQVFENFIRFTGSHIKRLIIRGVVVYQRNHIYTFRNIGGSNNVDPKILLKLLNMLPNLKSLAMDSLSLTEKPTKWDLKSTKIERLKVYVSADELEQLLDSLEKCAIKEVGLRYWSPKESEVIQKFLKQQEKNLKKLTIHTKFDMPTVIKDLRLEYLDFESSHRGNVSLEFLKNLIDLKFLKLRITEFSTIPDETFNLICELKNLETLELVFYNRATLDTSGLNNLHKLQKLKKFKVVSDISKNILEHLQFGVFNNLEDLDAGFEGASVESAMEMKRIAPNLKEITILTGSSDTINAFLENLEHLESVKIWCDWKIPDKVYEKIKHLSISFRFGCKLSAYQLSNKFVNLKSLIIYNCPFKVTKSSLVTLLNGMKQLENLTLRIHGELNFDTEFVMQCFRGYGKNLEEFEIDNDVFSHLSDYESCKIVPGFQIWEHPRRKFRVRRARDFQSAAQN